MARLIGVFGGTFDPPHLGHLILASEALMRLNLDAVYWVLTPMPPHKPQSPVSPLEDRIAMLEVVLHRDPEFEFSEADIKRSPPHYALGTMEWLRNEYPEDEFVYLMGSDSLRDLHSWHRASDFLAECKSLGVFRRHGAVVDLGKLELMLPGVSSKVQFIDGPVVDVSAREIRERVRVGERFEHLVPYGVAEVIKQRGLYI